MTRLETNYLVLFTGLLLYACSEDFEQSTILRVKKVEPISNYSLVVSVSIIDLESDINPTAYGICWSLTTDLKNAPMCVESMREPLSDDTFILPLKDIPPGESINLRPYVKDADGKLHYGYTFSYLNNTLPYLGAIQITSFTNEYYDFKFTIENRNSEQKIDQLGLVWQANQSPTLGEGNVQILEEIDSASTARARIYGFENGTTYHLRSFANVNGLLYYGKELVFKTPQVIYEGKWSLIVNLVSNDIKYVSVLDQNTFWLINERHKIHALNTQTSEIIEIGDLPENNSNTRMLSDGFFFDGYLYAGLGFDSNSNGHTIKCNEDFYRLDTRSFNKMEPVLNHPGFDCLTKFFELEGEVYAFDADEEPKSGNCFRTFPSSAFSLWKLMANHGWQFVDFIDLIDLPNYELQNALKIGDHLYLNYFRNTRYDPKINIIAKYNMSSRTSELVFFEKSLELIFEYDKSLYYIDGSNDVFLLDETGVSIQKNRIPTYLLNQNSISDNRCIRYDFMRFYKSGPKSIISITYGEEDRDPESFISFEYNE